MKQTVHALWIGDQLSPVELLCIHSFLNFGYTFHLWIYSPIENIPEQVVVCDANEILTSKHIFRYNHTNQFGHGKGSLAGFSDIFRYKLLYEKGGIWVDMDITCLKAIDIAGEYIFRYHGKEGVVGNFIKCPPKSAVMKYCYEKAVKLVNADNTDWMLPLRILREGIYSYNLQNFIYNISNEDSWLVIVKLLKKNIPLPDWYFIHWVNEEFRNQGIGKDQYLETSVMHHLLEDYDIPHTVIKNSDEIRKYKWKVSRIYYTYLHFKNLFDRIFSTSR